MVSKPLACHRDRYTFASNMKVKTLKSAIKGILIFMEYEIKEGVFYLFTEYEIKK